MGLFDKIKKLKDVAQTVIDNPEKVMQAVSDRVTAAESDEKSSAKTTVNYTQSSTAPMNNFPVAAPANAKAHFDGIIAASFPQGSYRKDVPAREIFSAAHPACTPVQYMFYKNSKPCLAVVLVKRNTYNGMNVKGTKLICENSGIRYLRFFEEMPNEEAYVVERIKNSL